MASIERDRVIRCLAGLLEVNQDFRRRIRANEVVIRRAIKEVEKGSTIAATMAATNARLARQSVNEGLDALTFARHEARLAIMAAGLSEGMSIGELGRAWGISRQLASRFAKEAQVTSDVPETVSHIASFHSVVVREWIR